MPPKEESAGSTSLQFTDKFQDNILSLLGSTDSSTNFNSEHLEYVYKKLLGDPLARSRIENLHAARAHKYGHAQFGPKSWYQETLNLAKKWKSQDDRRKFRMGLKGIVYFLNQLNQAFQGEQPNQSVLLDHLLAFYYSVLDQVITAAGVRLIKASPDPLSFDLSPFHKDPSMIHFG